MSRITQAIQITCNLLSVAMRVMLAVMFVIFISLVITRYFFSYSPPWSEEVSRFLLIWISMLGASVLIVYQDHFALHMLVQKLSPKMKLYHSLAVQFIVLVVCIVVFYHSIEFATSSRDVIAPGSQISLFYPKLSLPVGMALMIVFALISLADIARQIAEVEHSFIPPQTLFMDSTFRQTEPITADSPAPQADESR